MFFVLGFAFTVLGSFILFVRQVRLGDWQALGAWFAEKERQFFHIEVDQRFCIGAKN